jgi:hypothetical protein
MHSIGRLEPFQPKIRRLRTRGTLKADELAFRALDTPSLTEAERTDSVNYPFSIVSVRS